MEGVICVAVSFCFFVSIPENGEEGGVGFALGCECYYGGGASANCGTGACCSFQLLILGLKWNRVVYQSHKYLRFGLSQIGAALQGGRGRRRRLAE